MKVFVAVLLLLHWGIAVAEEKECLAPSGLEDDIIHVFRHSLDKSAAFFDKTDTSMGPIHLWCERVRSDGDTETLIKRSLGDWPAENEDVGLAMRSLSKLYVSVALLALFRLPEGEGISLDTKVSEFIDTCGGVGSATIKELLAMNASAFDNRIAAIVIEEQDGSSTVDHVGWPPKCDTQGLSVSECIEEHVCPLYEDDNLFDADSVEDVTCVDKEARCHEFAQKGTCFMKPRAMITFCPVACGLYCCDVPDLAKTCMMMKLDKSLCETTKDSRGKALGPTACRKTCGACSKENDIKAYGWYFSFDEKKGKMVKKQRSDCIYENYGYTIVDYMVEKATGKPILHWILELVLKPLNMQTSLNCMGYGDESSTCYLPPKTVDDHVSSDKWPKVAEFAPHSMNWISNAIMSSPRDLMTLSLMLMNNGTWHGHKILEAEDVDAIFSPINTFNNGGNCMGTQEFGLGVGHCRAPEPMGEAAMAIMQKLGKIPKLSTSLCATDDFWTWAGSYGSRFLYFRDYSIACTAMANQNTIPSISTKNRISSRSHSTGHDFAKAIRKHFPAKAPLPPATV